MSFSLINLVMVPGLKENEFLVVDSETYAKELRRYLENNEMVIEVKGVDEFGLVAEVTMRPKRTKVDGVS